MTIGSSLFVIAVGAILRYAVKDPISGVDISTIGLILMLVGAVGFLIGLYFTFVRREPPVAVEEERIRRPARY
jgi:hypothetical protein